MSACTECAADPCQLKRLAHGGDRVRMDVLQRGDRLESADGRGCLRFWTIVEGWAATCTVFSDGRRQIVGLETPGDVVCAAMASDVSQSWLEALCETRICEIDLNDNGAGLRKDAGFLGAVFGITHRRLARSEAHVSTLGRLDSRERVMLFLAEMARRSRGQVTHLPMSREDIADYLGLNAETVSRILSRLRKSGLVTFLNPTDYVVPDLRAIEDRLPVGIHTPHPGLSGPREVLP